MLDIKEALTIVQKNYPSGEVFSWIEYENLYLFKIFNNLPGEQEMDPFFTVNRDTGEFRAFSIITEGNVTSIITEFKRKEDLGDLRNTE